MNLDYPFFQSETIEECKEGIKDAIEIYLEGVPEGQSIFKPSPLEYWRMFYEKRQSSK